MKEFIKGANPYMPLWEHVPDGEPRVFEHNGEKRVYVYGSHDIAIDEYCGRNYVVWSAPIDDLTDWKYHGVAYETHYDSILYAPDVVKKGDTYYMYADVNPQRASGCQTKQSTGPAFQTDERLYCSESAPTWSKGVPSTIIADY